MSQVFEKRLAAIAQAGPETVVDGRRGIEKESLRIDKSGQLAKTPHPAALGSALTNQYITTDFSEALLEFITPAYRTTWEAIQFLCDIHQFAYARLGDELMWTTSMPCRLPAESEIPLARYGSSNVGQMKTIYRRGLGYRYGRNMQTIAGAHFNYSMPESFWPVYAEIQESCAADDAFRSTNYLRLVRNFRRFGWLALYLFGASPAMCRSFDTGSDLKLARLGDDTWYEPFATSLRMSDIGYSNRNQARINISLNTLDAYIRDLGAAMHTPEPEYQDIGIIVDGAYRQLNANLLQIENEYYSPIRPKRVARSGERPTAALQRGGIEYVEIRSLDLSVDDPAGINQNTMRFMEAFLLYCLLEDSPDLDEAELEESKRNQTQTAKRGRDPKFNLYRHGKKVTLRAWASEILEGVAAIAELMDGQVDSEGYGESVALMQSLVADPARTPSAVLLDTLIDSKCSFFELALDVAERHRDYFASIKPLVAERSAQFEAEAEQSIQRQLDIEASDDISLEEYLQTYFG